MMIQKSVECIGETLSFLKRHDELLRSEIAGLKQQLAAAQREVERMRAVYEQALLWRAQLIGERTSYDLELEAAIDTALANKENGE